MILISAISCWNTVYLAQTYDLLERMGHPVPDHTIPNISPLGWDHINFLGRYTFNLNQPHSLDNLRDLRPPRRPFTS